MFCSLRLLAFDGRGACAIRTATPSPITVPDERLRMQGEQKNWRIILAILAAREGRSVRAVPVLNRPWR